MWKRIKTVWSVLVSLPSVIVAAVETFLVTTKPYFETALEFVELAVTLTPNRTDDEIVAFAKYVMVDTSIVVPGRPKGDIIRDIVREVLKRYNPGVADRWLNRAIELAYAAVKP